MKQGKPTALLSVADKFGIVGFAAELESLGWQLLGSKGTAEHLNSHGLRCEDVSALVGEPILGHRVVTLSREIHAALLAQDTPEDRAELARIGVPRIDLVCVDLYPLEKEIERKGSTEESVIEQTDIGGPAMLRAAAKGRRIVVSRREQRREVLDWIRAGQPKGAEMRRRLAAEAEATCAFYSVASADYLSGGVTHLVAGQSVADLKYGENPWQVPARLYSLGTSDQLSLDKLQLVEGAPPGYCNLTDIDRLLQTVTHVGVGLHRNFGRLPRHICAAVKHGNACGTAVHDDGTRAIELTIDGDRRAVFGATVMVSFPLDVRHVDALLKHGMPSGRRRKLDTVVVPAVTREARLALKARGCRVMLLKGLAYMTGGSIDRGLHLRGVRGGFLLQPNYGQVLDLSDESVMSNRKLDPKEVANLVLAWAIGATSNSNTVCLVKNGQLIGNGMGQMDRVTAARHAIEKAREAGHDPRGAVAYSDSFFPFADALLALEGAGVKTVLSCSGSVNDESVATTASRLGVTLVLVPHTKARGFFGH